MCGICGAISTSGGRPDPTLVEDMCRTLVHRGPDDQGVAVSGSAVLGARRLSIIDVEAGHQPVSNEDGTVWAALNGEIYNHPQLIDDLARRGHEFHSHCDSEVLVHLYEEYGADLVEHIDGMYGISVWDSKTETLLLARDRLGIKPLFYARAGDTFLFGSELQALVVGGLPLHIDITALDAFLTLSYVPAPFSILSGAHKLLPGRRLVLRRGNEDIAPYWHLPEPETPGRQGSDSELAQELLRLLRSAVKSHLISDVPLGAFLSGGLDSSTVVALMAEASSGPVRTFSIGFQEQSYDETRFAREVAERFATDHHEIVQRPEPESLALQLSGVCDEPFGDSSIIPTRSVSELARSHVKVALTGDGGDEVFGGYVVYRADRLAGLYRRLPASVRQSIFPGIVRRLPSSDSKASLDFRLKRFVRSGSEPPEAAHIGWRTIFPAETRRRLLGNAKVPDAVAALATEYYWDAGSAGPVDRALRLDTLLGLPDDMLTKVDRATMSVSLEARVPLLDRSVVEFMARLPERYKLQGWTLKPLLKTAVAGILPQSIINRKKEGFSIPVAAWTRRDLRDLIGDTVTADRFAAIGSLRWDAVSDVLADHWSGRADRGREVWSLLMLSLWHQRFSQLNARAPLSRPLEVSSAQ